MQCKLCGIVKSRRDKMTSHLRSLDSHGLQLVGSNVGRPVGFSFGARRSRSPPRRRSSSSRRSRVTFRKRRDSTPLRTSSESGHSVASPRRRAGMRPTVGVSAGTLLGLGSGVVGSSVQLGSVVPPSDQKLLTVNELAMKVIPG